MSVAPILPERTRLRSFAVVALVTAVLASGAARADCGADLGALMNKRVANIAVLNQNTKAHGGKLDPISACPQLRALAAAEATVLAYMNKNKDWCSIPDDLISKMTESRAKSATFAAKACDFAVKMKKMQAQRQAQQQQGAAAQQEQAVKLPSGPL